MKRLFGLMILVLLSVGLGACGADSAETTPDAVLPLADDRATLLFFLTDN